MINNVEFSLFLIDMASWQQEDEKCSNHYFQEKKKSDLPMDFFIFSLLGFCHDYNHLYIYIYIKPKPLLAPQFSTLAQYLKKNK